MEGGRGNSLRWRLEAVSDELLMLLYLSGGPGSMYSNNTHTHTEIYIVCSLSLSLFFPQSPPPLSRSVCLSVFSSLSLSLSRLFFCYCLPPPSLSHIRALFFLFSLSLPSCLAHPRPLSLLLLLFVSFLYPSFFPSVCRSTCLSIPPLSPLSPPPPLSQSVTNTV